MSLRMFRLRVKEDIHLRGIQEWEQAVPRQANFHLPLVVQSLMLFHPLVQAQAEAMEAVQEGVDLLGEEVAEEAAVAGKPTLQYTPLIASSPMSYLLADER